MAAFYSMGNRMYAMYSAPENLSDAESQPHMKKLFDARQAFNRPMMNLGKSNVETERVYYDLYKDILDHEEFWFTRVYHLQAEPTYAEWTVGILGTLATIRRQRGDVKKCLEVLELDERILKIYQQTTNYENPPEAACARGLTYKYNLIATNANTQMKNKRAALKAFREAVKYEIEEGYNFDQQNFGFMLDRFDGTEYMTLECLESTPDDTIWSVLLAGLQVQSGGPDLRVEQWICDGCGQKEELCGDFLRCSACKKAHYCSKDCQRKHWKLHKPECKKKVYKHIKVDSAAFKDAANLVVDNFATTVLMHTGQQVSVEQKRAAFPGLVKLMKDFVLRNRKYNSDAGFADAGRDADLNAEMCKYFEEQPGYETLVQIHQKPYVREHIESTCGPPAENELVVGEDYIEDYVKTFMVHIFATLRAVGKTDQLDESSKDALQAKMVSMMKEYILAHPEHNSFKGFQDMKDNKEVRDMMVNVVTQFCEENNLLDD